MGRIEIETLINAPILRCFDLARSADFHVASTKSTGERIVGGVTKGLMKLNDEIEFEARHLGVKQRLRARIHQFNEPKHFRDSQVRGIFQSFDHDHDHDFETTVDGQTMMRDTFAFVCPLGPLGKIADPLIAIYLERFLKIRAAEIKNAAESDLWKAYL
jgi:ligand-binding SRPBCC domain-containing protein